MPLWAVTISSLCFLVVSSGRACEREDCNTDGFALFQLHKGKTRSTFVDDTHGDALSPAKRLEKTVVEKPRCYNRVAFFHIPKSGGRSVMKALGEFVAKKLAISRELAEGLSESRWTYIPAEQRPMMSQQETESYVMEFHTTEARAFHVIPDLKNITYEDGCKVLSVTVLREPIQRTVSMLNYDMETGCLPKDAKEHANYLFESVSDQQTRFLSAHKYCPVCGDFWTQEKKLCQDVTAEEQSDNIRMLNEDMDVVGISEDLDNFGQEVLHRMGFSDSDVKDFVVPKYDGFVTIHDGLDTNDTIGRLPDDWISSIKTNGAFDFELYEEAKKLSNRYTRAAQRTVSAK